MSTSMQSSYLTKQEKIEGELISWRGGGPSNQMCYFGGNIRGGGISGGAYKL